MASTADHIAARGDADLLARMIAAAEQEGVPNAQAWVQQNMGQLINVVVEQGQTISDVYAYAYNVRNEQIDALPEAPGKNPGAVTDTHLRTAVEALLVPVTPQE